MIDKELLEILVCPDTHQPLRVATAEEVERVNRAIAGDGAPCVGGEKTTEKIDAGLVREDGRVLYPIRAEIPVLLVEEGILLTE